VILLSPDAVSDIERLRIFLGNNNAEAAKRALAAIWTAIEQLQQFPNLGSATNDDGIRQIIVRFGASGYVVRYTFLQERRDILVTRLWHGREARM
jgi:toxin ParE1/3/4